MVMALPTVRARRHARLVAPQPGDVRVSASVGPAGEVVARSKPDGLTMFATSAMTQAVNPAIYDKLPYDPIESFDLGLELAALAANQGKDPARAAAVYEGLRERDPADRRGSRQSPRQG